MEIAKVISAILFYQAEPVSIGRLSTLLKQPEGEIRDALMALEPLVQNAGLALVRNGDEVTLSTAPEAHALIEAITKEELSKDLSKAALETLAIVLYKGPITRSEIDYIRGVNSTFILRNLLVRGLVEKIENPEDQRSFLYKSTFQLLEYMGVGKIEELPSYHDAIAQLGAFVATTPSEENTAVTTEMHSAENDGGGAEVREEEASTIAQEMEEEAEDLLAEADIIEMDEVGSAYQDDVFDAHQHHSPSV